MAIIKCSKGHYYDSTKFSQCPHCGVLPIMEQEQQQEAAKPRRFSFFHKPGMKKPEMPVLDEDDERMVAMPVPPKPFLPDEDDDDHTIAMPKMPEAPASEEDDDHTVAMPGLTASEADEDDDHTIAMPVAPGLEASEADEDDDHTIAMPAAPGLEASEADEDDDHTIAMLTAPGLEASEADEDDDHTIAMPAAPEIIPSETDEDDDRTIAIPKPQIAMPVAVGSEDEDDDRTIAIPKPRMAEPEMAAPEDGPAFAEPKTPSAGTKPAGFVVGWLVCVDGPERGCDYRLYKGFNRLGSGSRVDIQIKGDSQLGDGAALAVVYDDKSNEFFAVQQTGKTAFLNGENLQGAVRLSSGDVVKAGDSEFEFVAFCREGRAWESYE